MGGRAFSRSINAEIDSEHKFARMEGYILSTNAAMLGLAKRLGFATIESPEDPAVRLVRRDLAGTYVPGAF